jgi:antitoxin CptB
MTAFEKTCIDNTTHESSTQEPVTLSHLRWQCRRGMLELDILLNNFIDSFADSSATETNSTEDKVKPLTPQQHQTFELLLSYPDQTLIDLLLGNTMSADSKISAIVKLIRSTPINAEHSP